MQIEESLGICGSSDLASHEVAGFIDESFAASVIYSEPGRMVVPGFGVDAAGGGTGLVAAFVTSFATHCS